MAIPRVEHGSKMRALIPHERIKLEEFYLLCVRDTCGIRKSDGVSNQSEV